MGRKSLPRKITVHVPMHHNLGYHGSEPLLIVRKCALLADRIGKGKSNDRHYKNLAEQCIPALSELGVTKDMIILNLI